MKPIRKIRTHKASPTIWHVGFRNSKKGVILDIDLTVRDVKSEFGAFVRHATSYLIPREQLIEWSSPPQDLSAFRGKWKFKVGKMPKPKNRVSVS